MARKPPPSDNFRCLRRCRSAWNRRTSSCQLSSIPVSVTAGICFLVLRSRCRDVAAGRVRTSGLLWDAIKAPSAVRKPEARSPAVRTPSQVAGNLQASASRLGGPNRRVGSGEHGDVRRQDQSRQNRRDWSTYAVSRGPTHEHGDDYEERL